LKYLKIFIKEWIISSLIAIFLLIIILWGFTVPIIVGIIIGSIYGLLFGLFFAAAVTAFVLFFDKIPKKIWVKLPNNEKVQLRYFLHTGNLKVYHQDKQIVEVAPKSKASLLPSHSSILKAWSWIEKNASEGTAEFNIGENHIEISSRLCDVAASWWGFKLLSKIISLIYQQCEVIVKVNGEQVFRKRLI